MGNTFCRVKELYDGYYIDATISNDFSSNKKYLKNAVYEASSRRIYQFVSKNKEAFHIINFKQKEVKGCFEVKELLKSRNCLFLGISEEVNNEYSNMNLSAQIKKTAFGISDKIYIWYKDEKFSPEITELLNKFKSKKSYTKEDYFTFENYIISNVIGECLYNETTFEPKYISSSNVFANLYIDLRIVFKRPEIFFLVAHEMWYIINKLFESADYNIELVGVSVNGTILASQISHIFETKYSFINSLGPEADYSLDNKPFSASKNTRYIIVSDFICLGAEYKRAKVLIENCGAKVLGCISVAKFVDMYRKYEKCAKKKHIEQNKNIFSIIENINDLKCKFNYNVEYLEEKI